MPIPNMLPIVTNYLKIFLTYRLTSLIQIQISTTPIPISTIQLPIYFCQAQPQLAISLEIELSLALILFLIPRPPHSSTLPTDHKVVIELQEAYSHNLNSTFGFKSLLPPTLPPPTFEPGIAPSGDR